MTSKERLSISVDGDLLDAARAAVTAGLADNVSAWISDAMRRKVENDRRMAVLGKFVDEYEAVNGIITDEEMRDADRWAKSRAVVVRGDGASQRPSPGRGPA